MKKFEFSQSLKDPLMSPDWLLKQLIDIIKYESRFVIKEPYKSFMDFVVKMVCEQFSSIIPTETILYRARINKINFIEREHEKIPFPPSEMGPPPKYISISGRINPKGIPYLYCAGELETAGAELRPWKSAYLTIGEVKIKQDIVIADLTLPVECSDARWSLFFYDFTDMFAIQWPPELKLNYLVTQYFSELFKSAGLRGIKYKSEFNISGNNFALFYRDDYSIISSYSVETGDIDYSFYKKNNL